MQPNFKFEPAINQHNNLTMTRSELIMRLADLHPQLLTKDVDLAVKVILDSMSATLSRGNVSRFAASAVSA